MGDPEEKILIDSNTGNAAASGVQEGKQQAPGGAAVHIALILLSNLIALVWTLTQNLNAFTICGVYLYETAVRAVLGVIGVKALNKSSPDFLDPHLLAFFAAGFVLCKFTLGYINRVLLPNAVDMHTIWYMLPVFVASTLVTWANKGFSDGKEGAAAFGERLVVSSLLDVFILCGLFGLVDICLMVFPKPSIAIVLALVALRTLGSVLTSRSR
jgi:hypothetical protein